MKLQPKTDKATGAQVAIEYEHHEVHDGDHFFVTDFGSVANPNYKRWLVVTPNTTRWGHFLFRYTSASGGTFQLLETVTTSADGTGLAVFNSDRNSSTAATISVYKDPSVTVEGTLIFTDYVGTSGNPQTRRSGDGRAESEIILKQNTKYQLRFVPDAGTVNAYIGFSWYEHTNKI